MRLEDGKGSGQKALVDDHGRLYVLSVAHSHEAHHVSFHANFFTVTADTVLQGGVETPCLILVNDSSKDLELYWSTVSSDAIIKASYYLDELYTSGGTAKIPTNMNRASANASGVSTYEGGAAANLVVDTADSILIQNLYLGASVPRDFNFDGGLILPSNKSITIKATGALNDNVSVSFGFSFHEAGTKI